MNADGTPDMQDVREGNAEVTPDGSIIWLSDSNTVTITAPPRKADNSWMVLVLLVAGAFWMASE